MTISYISNKEKSTFLPGINKRYVKSFAGLFHATSSVVALVLGNYLFIQCFLLRNDILASSEVDNSSLLPTVFHMATALSGIILLAFFWNKIQSYQHSTTSLEEKGITPKQMQNVNRARGCYALILCAVYPLMYRYLPNETLQDSVFSRAVAAAVVALSVYMYQIFKVYGPIFFIYAGTKFGFSLHVLFTGSLYALRQSYPYIVNFFEKEALLISSCVEFGFLLYYCESRRIVTVQFLKDACKRYHPIMMAVFIGNMLNEKFWSQLPLSVSYAIFLQCIFVFLYLKNVTKGIISAVVETIRSKKESVESRRKAFAKKRLSSVFDVTSRTGRRSSIFESIDFGELSSSLSSKSD